MSRLAEYPAERRIQTLAIGALLATVAVDAALVGLAPVTLVGGEVPGLLVVGLLAVGLVLGVITVVRRDLKILAAAVVALVVPALAERPWEVTAYRFFGSVLFGFLLLAFGELVHMTTRYEKWHRAADEARTSAAELDHATEEYLRTFTFIFGASAFVAVAVGAVFAALLTVGPAQHRASLDFRSLYGLVGAAGVVFGALGLYALGRGADWRLPRRRDEIDDPTDAAHVPQVDADVLE